MILCNRGTREASSRTASPATNARPPTETNTYNSSKRLMLMNGKFIGDQTDLAQSEILGALPTCRVGIPSSITSLFPDCGRRKPTPEELDKFS